MGYLQAKFQGLYGPVLSKVLSQRLQLIGGGKRQLFRVTTAIQTVWVQ
jgi:hypothetical protein